jgi:predicted anti-sigma-YlaC factor YlaD
MKNGIKACKAMEAKLPALLPDLLLDPAAVPASVEQHMAGCEECRTVVDLELAAHRATFELLDSWEAPEMSPYFGSRMSALLREEQQSPRAGVVERVRSWLLLSNLHMKPMAGAAALGLLLAIGGGAYLDLSQSQPAAPVPQASATVRDLQSLDDNAQVFQQMSSLDAGDNDGGNSL